ncbi:MAG: N-acetylmuramoyl-L-alanine amidase [Candidatus Sumerlaeia bacterium]|nr:N-acetylmuramoyl-L-alanine amidase [Candidatus Sumerlaeia bacterium]
MWPPNGARVDGERIRVGGKTDPAGRVTVNGRPLRVFPSGAFAGTCPLNVGANTLTFRATVGEQSAVAVRKVTRSTPLQTLPAQPVRFDPNYDGQPSEDLVVRPGDVIRIRVKGSPGCRATFRIGSGETQYPLFAVRRYGCDGFYEGAYEVKPNDRFVQARVTCYLRGSDGAKDKSAVQMLTPGRITVNANPYPEVGRAREDYVRLRAEPRSGAPLLAVREGTFLNVDGRVGNMLRVALTPRLHGYVARESVVMTGEDAPLQRGAVENLAVIETETATLVRIPLGLRVPLALDQGAGGDSVELTLYGVENRLNWITDRTQRGLVNVIAALPSDDATCRLAFGLRAPLLGYRAWYEGEVLWLSFRSCSRLRRVGNSESSVLDSGLESGKGTKTVASSSQSAIGNAPSTTDTSSMQNPKSKSQNLPLDGMVVLLDPGHGGASKGTLGSTGVEEKTINLQMAESLRRRLESRGARVRMTRSDDREVSLAERVRMAELDADLFVSIHNNSVALDGDPLAARGMGVFYYHPHSRAAARAIYESLARVEPPLTPYGLVNADLYVVREVTAAPSVLLECLFLSHPEDEMLLLDPAYIERAMEAVAEGICAWGRGLPTER